MAKRLVALFLLVVSIAGIVLGCAAPASPTQTLTPTATATPGVTPTEVTSGVKPKKIHISQIYALTTTQGQYAEKFKSLVEERSGGKIKVDHYPSGQLFPDADHYHALGMGR